MKSTRDFFASYFYPTVHLMKYSFLLSMSQYYLRIVLKMLDSNKTCFNLRSAAEEGYRAEVGDAIFRMF